MLMRCNSFRQLSRRGNSVIPVYRKYSKPSYIHNHGSEPLKFLTVGELLEETAKKHGDVTAIISRHQKKELTFAQALDQADRLAAGLRTIGLQVGDCLGLWAPNLLEWYVSKLAAARAGLILVTINPAYQAKEIEYCIKKVGIKSIICSARHKTQEYYEILRSICPELANNKPGKISSKNLPSLKNLIIIGEESFRGAFDFEEIIKMASDKALRNVRETQNLVRVDDPCNIQFTSGTTGKSKAAVLSHFNLVNNGYFYGKRAELNKKNHRICVQVPFFHVFGTAIAILGSLNHGSTIVLPWDGYNAAESLRAIKEEKCTVIYGTPTMFVDLVKEQEAQRETISPDFALYGGAICPPNLVKQIKDVLNVKHVRAIYGLSETTAAVFQSLPDDDEYKTTSTVGYAAEHTEAMVVDQDGQVVPRGTQGELLIRSSYNMLEYWDDAEKTREIIGVNKWLKTGDHFIIDEDGYGRVVGRSKDVIIRGGENIFPREIEDYLATHPDIIEVHVIGLPHERLGEEVCACVRVKDGKSLNLDNIKAFCKRTLAHYKCPTKLNIVNTFPKTTSGKIQKFKLVEMLTQK